MTDWTCPCPRVSRLVCEDEVSGLAINKKYIICQFWIQPEIAVFSRHSLELLRWVPDIILTCALCITNISSIISGYSRVTNMEVSVWVSSTAASCSPPASIAPWESGGWSRGLASRLTRRRTTPTTSSACVWRPAGWPQGARGTRRSWSTGTTSSASSQGETICLGVLLSIV